MPKSSAQTFENSPTCTVFEYGGDEVLDGATAIINGRYPETGWAMNAVVREMIYVVKGSGKLVTRDSTVALSEDDVALLATNEPYYFEGDNLKIFMPTTPPWNPEQYEYLVD